MKGVRERNSRNKADVIRVIVKSLGADMRVTLVTSAGIRPVIIDARMHGEAELPEKEKLIVGVDYRYSLWGSALA